MTYELTSALGQPRQDFGRALRSTPEAQFIFTVDGWQSEPIVVFMPRFCVSTIRIAAKLPPDNTACLSLVLAIHSGHSFFSDVKVHMHIRRAGHQETNLSRRFAEHPSEFARFGLGEWRRYARRW